MMLWYLLVGQSFVLIVREILTFKWNLGGTGMTVPTITQMLFSIVLLGGRTSNSNQARLMKTVKAQERAANSPWVRPSVMEVGRS
jgi:hypothetical protein